MAQVPAAASAISMRLAQVAVLAALLAAPELMALARFRDLYTFVQYSGYTGLAEYAATAANAITWPVLVLGLPGLIIGLLVRQRRATTSAAAALVLYLALTATLVIFPAAANLAPQLEPTRLMPLQRFLTIYLAAVAFWFILSWVDLQDCALEAVVGAGARHRGCRGDSPRADAASGRSSARSGIARDSASQSLLRGDVGAAGASGSRGRPSERPMRRRLPVPRCWCLGRRSRGISNSGRRCGPSDHSFTITGSGIGTPTTRGRRATTFWPGTITLTPSAPSSATISHVMASAPWSSPGARARSRPRRRSCARCGEGVYDVYSVVDPVTTVTFGDQNATSTRVRQSANRGDERAAPAPR